MESLLMTYEFYSDNLPSLLLRCGYPALLIRMYLFLEVCLHKENKFKN